MPKLVCQYKQDSNKIELWPLERHSFLDYINVQDYGAKGDGVVDDTIAIAAAVTAASAGGTIVFPATSSYYKISDSITVDKALTLEGEGEASEIRQVTSNKGGFEITASNVTIKNLKLYGPQYAAYQSSEDAIYAHGTDNNPAAPTYITHLKIKDCYIQNWGDAGIQCKFVQHFEIASNYIEDCYYHGIMHHSCKNGRIHHNQVRDITGSVSGNAYGISLSKNQATGTDGTTDPICQDILVDHNDIYNVTNWEGIDTHGGQYCKFDANFIRDTKHGIVITTVEDVDGNFFPVKHNTVSNNTIVTGLGTVSSGINIAGDASGNSEKQIILGNYIEGYNKGIRIVHDNHSQVIGNVVYNSVDMGIQLQDEVHDVVVKGNNIDTLQAGADAGIKIESDTCTGIIEGNIIDATNADYGMNFGVSNYNALTVKDNKISGYGTAKYRYYNRIDWDEIIDNSDNATSGAGEDTLASDTQRASSLSTNMGIHIFAAGTKTGAAGNKTIKLYFGTTSWTVHPAANNELNWTLEAEIWNTAADAQRGWIRFWNDDTLVYADYITAAEDTSAGTFVIKLTGECADAGDTITQTMFRLKKLRTEN